LDEREIENVQEGNDVVKEEQSDSYYGRKSKENDTLVNTFISSSDNSFSLHEFKLSPEEIILFKKFVDEERSGENLQFLFDVYNFKEQTKFVRVSNETYKIWFDQIYNEYFSPNAPNPLNLRDRVIKGNTNSLIIQQPFKNTWRMILLHSTEQKQIFRT
jgi:hypothetical protein